MPVTPLHMGPGLLLKGAAERHFSLLVFGFSQVVMDLEPAVRMLRQDTVLHGWTHTYVGATLLGALSLLIGRPLCQYLLRRFQPDPRSPFLVWLHGGNHISWRTAAISAFLGTYSHVFLDSFMHDDMRPFAPWSDANALHLGISVDGLHLVCIGTGLAGVLLLAVSALRGRARTP